MKPAKTDRRLPCLNSPFVRKALSVHAAIGLLAGALLYILCVSGTLVVIHQEWQRWEQPRMPDTPGISAAAVERGALRVIESEAGKPRTTHLWVHLPVSGLPRAIVTTDHQAVHLDPDGNIAGREEHRWTEFMLDMHYYLHLPMTAGLTLVGGLGVMMLALAVGGILAHPRIFRDAFRLRSRSARRVALTDWHNRLGVWTLPFSVAIGLTGAVLGLATIAAVIISTALYDGNPETVFQPIFGEEQAADPRPAPIANIPAALGHMQAEFPQVQPTYVILHDPGTRGQHLQILADHPRRLIFGEYYEFGADGTFHGTGGMADGAIGKQAVASAYKLHFGSFGGLPVKLAYILLGLALSVISATGMSIWLSKRRQKGRGSAALEGFWAAIVWGTPVLIAATAALRLLGGPDLPFALLFWFGLAGLATAGLVWRNPARLRTGIASALGFLLVAVPIIHQFTAGEAYGHSIALNAAMFVTGIGIVLVMLRRRRQSRSNPATKPQLAAAT
jgi:uncharacterized iron-regulated membrane protein